MAFLNGQYYDEYNPANYYNTPGQQGVWDPTGAYAKSVQNKNPLANATVPTTQTTNPALPAWASTIDPNQSVTRSFSSPTGVSTGTVSDLPTAPPDLTAITNLVNQLNLNAQQQANQNRIPGAAGLEQQSSNNIASLLAGNVPADVKRNIYQSAAERGISTGSPGSDNANSSLLQSLGLTSLGMQQQGQANLTSALARNPAAPIFDPTTQLLTPAQKLAAEAEAKRLGLAWWQALYGNRGNVGTGRGTGGGQQQPTSTPNMDWFTNAMRTATGGTPSPQYPGTINWQDPYGGYNPEWPGVGESISSGSPFQATGVSDASSPDYWNWDLSSPTTDTTNLNDYYNAGYDPFSGYYDPGMAQDVNPETGY